MHWIVEKTSEDSSYHELVQEIKNQNLGLIELKKEEITNIPVNFTQRPTIFHGSIETCKLIQNTLKIRWPFYYPLTYCSFDNYKCSKYYSYFGDNLFNKDYSIINLKELGRQRFFYYGSFGKEAKIFIRPDSGDKPFTAQLLDIVDLDKFLESHQNIEHELIIISSPKDIIGEWRFIVTKNKEILGYSLYMYQGLISKMPHVPEEAINFVKKLLEIDYYPDNVFTIDIVQNSSGFHLLELNSFSTAGLYACKLSNIVKKVSEIAREDFDIFCQFHQTHI